MIRSYLRLALFALGLLLGVQVPGFIDDYAKRVEAHRLESEQSLSGFRDTARRFFDGDLQRLVGHYRNSSDPVMQNDARSVGLLVERSALLEQESLAMKGPWYRQVWHLATAADSQLLAETRAAYRYQVLLAPEAIAWGIACALFLAWVVESILLLLALPFRRRERRSVPERQTPRMR
ncbi:DUF2937 family protein [Pseudomonas sp. CNPSo 3701]|uniref:DUF2937 family protein n=1 Tax=Pseudomonas sp. CNPSo 3701 TaxID=3027943 RepID=UPI002363EEB0|nr:DUF2937 family protein [Pseudomonas sp. CNPSo 3701]MDD1508479.1 DUF2937 family protein [Pseudomonas sp. CNPSo 3701]